MTDLPPLPPEPKSVEQTMADHGISRATAEYVVSAVAEVEEAKAARRHLAAEQVSPFPPKQDDAQIPPSEAELDEIVQLGYDRETFRYRDGTFDATSTDLLRRTLAARMTGRYIDPLPRGVPFGELPASQVRKAFTEGFKKEES